MNEAQRITEWVEQKKESAIALARAVWGFAEPNWRETQSAAAISAALEAEGFALERRPCGMETAFVATWGGEGPVIAFLGEYDALPALSQQAGRAEKAPLCEGAPGHGCGHNLLGAGSFAAAVALKDYCRETGLPAEIAVWSQKLSRRHFSIGADGIICICPPLTADGDATMRMFNADGSEGKMCGNGVRCVAQFLYTHGVPKDVIEIDTLMAGRKTLHRKGEGLWQAEMGHFSAMADTLPAVGLGAGPLVHAPLTAAGKTWDAACISTGNPHCIIEWSDCDTLPTGHALAAIGPEFEHHPAFPEGVNTEFVYIESPTSVVMRVWERGSGETFACGTGSCATVAALVLRGVCPRNVPVDVHLLGGILSITITADDNILMTGPAKTAFVGCVEV